MASFDVGQTLVEREVWGDRVWLSSPRTVVADDGDVLAVSLVDGAPFHFDDEQPVHPWAPREAWRGPTVLQLRRAGAWYSVWKFFDGADFCGWYVNFERPFVRRHDGIDTDDLELDLVVDPDGTRHWKDVEFLHQRVAEGRFTAEDLLQVLEEAAIVTDLLDRDDRWWSPWDTWTPPAG